MPSPRDSKAFTIKASGPLNRIITEIEVLPAFDPADTSASRPAGRKVKALWDTGASRSVVSEAVVAALSLKGVGVTDIKHGGGTRQNAPTYLVNFQMDHGVGVAGLIVTDFPGNPQFDVLVGMDVICHGDLAITNVDKRTWVSFRMPSCESVDYVIQAHRDAFAGTNRNAPCPCQSGKKYKKCHGAVA